MFARTLVIAVAAFSSMLATAAFAETIEVKMLNKGEEGSMVFEPAYISAQPGDTVLFVSTDRGHNAESMKGMLPAGVEPFKSKMSVDFSLTVTEEGIYGIKCTPHYGMGMVAVIQVGAPVNLEEAQAVKQRGKSKKRFEAIFAQVVQ